MKSNDSVGACPDCGKPRRPRCTYCAKCGSGRAKARRQKHNKNLARNRHEKSLITEKRKFKCVCPTCGIKHSMVINVPINKKFPEPRPKFCKLHAYLAERDYEDSYSVGMK